jgi:hypothetical protein
MIRMQEKYVLQDGTLTQAGYSALRETEDGLAAAVADIAAAEIEIVALKNERRLLATRTASTSSSLDFTEFDNAVYRRYEFELENVLAATDDVALLLRTSTNGGSSYDSGASDYQWSINGMNGTAAANSGSAGAGSIVLTSNTAGARPGNAAGEYGVSGIVQLFNAGNGSSPVDVQTRISYMSTATAYSHYVGAGTRVAAADVDAVRFVYNGSNTTSGTIRMYGMT